MCCDSLGSVRRSASRSRPLRIGQAGADQRHELLIEDQELLEVELLAAWDAGPMPTPSRGLDRVDQEALLGIAVAQLALGIGFSHLLVHFAARVGVFEGPLSHVLKR